MKTPRLRHSLIALLATAAVPAAFAGAFGQNGAGPYEYTTAENWIDGVIGNNWTSNITANQTITFAADYTTADNDGGGAGVAGLSIANTGLFNHTFVAGGVNRTLTLGGGISLASTGNTNTNKVTIGSNTEGQKLNVDLGTGGKTFSIGANRTLEIVNVISGAGGVTAAGSNSTSILKLSDNNSFAGALNLTGGAVVEVTKLANGTFNSSIGNASNNNANISFGGSSAATLRYIGAGDSTDRRFNVGGAGGQFDASGSGAINWSNTGSLTFSSAGQARTVTLKGTNSDDNIMGASFIDSGVGKTSIHKQGTGRWILGQATGTNNTFTGDLIIDAGTLQLGSDTAGGNGANLILNGGAFATGGFSETFGTLALNGNATLDLGAGDSDLTFANSSAVVWGTSISLSIVNFTDGTDSVFFGVGGLTGDQIAQIRINGTHYAALDGSGFLALGAAIPEPSTYALLVGVGGLLLASSRRQRRAA